MMPEGTTHLSPGHCINDLRRALIRQNEIAQSLGFEISVRFLCILEELVKDPAVGLPYKVHDGEQLKHLPADMVSGIFSSILMKYREKCEWSPLYELKQQLQDAKLLLKRATMEMAHSDLRDRIDAFVTPPGAPAPGPSGS
jgi:hypothetical protein